MHIAMPPDMSDDVKTLAGVARSLRNRELEIEENASWVETRNAMLQREIDSIWSYRRDEVIRCVRRLTGGKSKSYKVPGYQFGEKKSAASIQWNENDKDKLVKWAKENCPDAITTSTPDPREAITKAALIEYHKKTGRVPWGCTFKSEGDVPYARAIKKKVEADDE